MKRKFGLEITRLREILNITRQKSEMISKQEVAVVRLQSEQFVMQ